MKIWVTSAVVLLCCLRGKPDEISVSAKEAEAADGAVSAADRQVLADYKEYLDRLDGIERQADIGRNGFAVIEEQIFSAGDRVLRCGFSGTCHREKVSPPGFIFYRRRRECGVPHGPA